MKKEYIFSLAQVDDIARELKNVLKDNQVLTFTGPLGAGKTTLIRALMKQLNVSEDEVTSPTFNYLNSYKTPDRKHVYHFDLYRIPNIDRFIESGFHEYLYQPDSIAIIEWPEIILSLLTHDVCHVSIDYAQEPDKRTLMIECK